MTKLAWRRTWFQIHKWIGLLLAILIIPLSLSGAALVWHDALDRVVDPARYRISGYAALVVQAGTATSTRERGEVNSFNVIRTEPARIEVDRYGWDSVHGAFQLLGTEKFLRSGNVWTEQNDSLMAAGI